MGKESRISLDVLTKEITVSQSTYALKINTVTVRARAQPEDKVTPAEIRGLRECNVQWLAKESRPDLAVQVSLSQQTLRDPRVRHCRQANAMVRRAKTTPRFVLAFSSNTIGKVTAGDAFRCGFSKCSRGASQADCIISVTDDRLAKRRIGTSESVDLAKSQDASSCGQHIGCRNTESFEWSWAC